MEELKIIGNETIEGVGTFLGLEGGFGKDKKCMLVKDIANIHNKEIKYLNKQINSNRKRFKDNIDIIDLKTGSPNELVLRMKELGIFTQAQVGNAKNIYILSERGYSKLLKILEDDFAWEQYDKLVDNYFTMRNSLQQVQAIDQGMMLQLAKGTQIIGQVVTSMQTTINNMQEFVKDSIVSKDIQIEETADMIGIRDKNTKFLTNTLKEKLSDLTGVNITAKDETYVKMKFKIFKQFKVCNWECIPINQFNAVYAYIDGLEKDDITYYF